MLENFSCCHQDFFHQLLQTCIFAFPRIHIFFSGNKLKSFLHFHLSLEKITQTCWICLHFLVCLSWSEPVHSECILEHKDSDHITIFSLDWLEDFSPRALASLLLLRWVLITHNICVSNLWIGWFELTVWILHVVVKKCFRGLLLLYVFQKNFSCCCQEFSHKFFATSILHLSFRDACQLFFPTYNFQKVWNFDKKLLKWEVCLVQSMKFEKRWWMDDVQQLQQSGNVSMSSFRHSFTRSSWALQLCILEIDRQHCETISAWIHCLWFVYCWSIEIHFYPFFRWLERTY